VIKEFPKPLTKWQNFCLDAVMPNEMPNKMPIVSSLAFQLWMNVLLLKCGSVRFANELCDDDLFYGRSLFT
jgi:hypothetical protein